MLKYCSIGSGSSGNCHAIMYKDTGILIDAGLTGKTITAGIKHADFDIEKIRGIFITHEHSDHIKGAGVMSRKLDIPIYANLKTWQQMVGKIGNIKEENMVVFENDKTYAMGDLKIRPFSIPHDSEDAVGYNIYSDKSKMSIATDIGYITENIRKNLKNSKLVVLESNYDPNMLMMGSYSYALKKRVMSEGGHLSNEEAAGFCTELVEGGTESILLAHLSKENNFPELAYATSKNVLTNNNMIVDKDLKLDVLRRDQFSMVHELD